MKQFTDIWEITPETAHPKSRQLLGDHSIIWNYGDEDSPLGTDTGADTFAEYLEFRAEHPSGGAKQFLAAWLLSLGIANADWDLVDSAGLSSALEVDDGFSVLRRDDVVMSLAFAQLLIEGTVDSEIKKRVLLALRRQATDVVLLFRGGDGAEVRKKQLMGVSASPWRGMIEWAKRIVVTYRGRAEPVTG